MFRFNSADASMTLISCNAKNISKTTARQIAQLHIDSLPSSSINTFGKSFCASFYEYVSSTTSEQLFILHHNDEIAGVCLLSLAPQKFDRRLLFHTSLLARICMRPKMLSKLVLQQLKSFYKYKKSPYQIACKNNPELLLIYSSSNRRGLGIGSTLIRQCEKFLRENAYSEYYLKTLDSPENAAIRFYSNMGFVETGRIDELDKSYLVFGKKLSVET